MRSAQLNDKALNSSQKKIPNSIFALGDLIFNYISLMGSKFFARHSSYPDAYENQTHQTIIIVFTSIL
jgi:hypothetical protein